MVIVEGSVADDGGSVKGELCKVLGPSCKNAERGHVDVQMKDGTVVGVDRKALRAARESR